MSQENFELSGSARSAIIDVVKLGDKADKQLVKAGDALHADGVRSMALETEKNGGSIVVRNAVKSAIYSGLSDAEKRLIDADVKTLTDVQKLGRNEAKGKIDKYLVKIRNHMKTAESDGTGDAQETKTDMQRIQKLLDDAITKIQKLDTPDFNAVDVIKLIKTAKGAMPSV
jgi:hypothetical protein